MNRETTNKSLLQSVQSGMSILKLFSKEKPVWGITEIANMLHLHKSTVSRLIGDLVQEDFLEKTGNKYRLGLSILSLSGVINSHLEINREAHEPIKSLVNRLEETAHLTILEDFTVAYLLKIDCKHPIRLLSYVGKRNPASCTSSGKVMLAFQSEKVVNKVLDNVLPKMGPNSVTDPKELLEQLKEISLEGYSVCIDELHEDVVSISAPIRDYTGEVIAAVSVTGPKERIKAEKIPEFISEIKNTSKLISEKLGYIESIFN